MCKPRRTSKQREMSGCSCGCCECGCGRSFRRFFSCEEERECLETYRDQLKKELAGVAERIDEFKSK